MPKIFHISGALNFGAPGRIVEQIGLLSQKNGYECLVAHSSRNENPSQLQHYAITTRWQEVVHALGAKFLDLHGLLSTKQTRELVERIKEYQPDIIHLHNIHGYFCNFKVLFEYLDSVDTPVVWTLHDCWPFTGRCFHFVGVDCYKWKTGCYDCKAEPGYTVSKYYDRSEELYALKKRLFSSVKNLTLVPVSDWQAAFLKDSFLKDCNVHTIHNGVDIEKFRPLDGNRLRDKHKLNGKYVILGVAPGNVGLTAMHTMVFGTPVISHNDFKWQMPEFEAIKPGKTGDFFERNSVQSLACTISKWFTEKKDKRDKVRQACYEEIDTNWNQYYQMEIIKKNLIF